MKHTTAKLQFAEEHKHTTGAMETRTDSFK